MDYNGDVLMCPHDWEKIIWKHEKDNFLNIWTSKEQLRLEKLNKSDRNFSPCNVCDVKGDLIGKKHAESW